MNAPLKPVKRWVALTVAEKAAAQAELDAQIEKGWQPTPTVEATFAKIDPPPPSVNAEVINGPLTAPEPLSEPALPPKATALELFGTFAMHKLFGIDANVQCTCDRPADEPGHKPGKHPDSPHGLDDVAQSREQIEAWPDSANYGIRTSTENGLTVVDDDPRNKGHKTLVRLESELGALPPTPTVITGGYPVDGVEGRHRYFLLSDSAKGQRYNKYFGPAGEYPGVDLQGERHYVVGPGSRHVSGRLYRWAPGLSPSEIAFAVLPEKWAAFALTPVQNFANFNGKGLEDTANQEELDAAEKHLANSRQKYPTGGGQGNTDLYKACAILRCDWGLSPEQALPILVRHNALTHNKRSEAELFAMLERADVGHGVRGQKRAAFRWTVKANERGEQTLANALAAMFSARASANDNAPSDIGGAAMFRKDGPNLITNIYASPVEAEVVDETIKHLARTDPGVYDFCGALVILSTGDENATGSVIPFGTPRLVPLTRDGLTDRISRYTRYYVMTKEDGRRNVRVPAHVAPQIMARTVKGDIRRTVGLLEAPSLRPDGSLIAAPGYDAATGFFLLPGVNVDVPERASIDDARAALALLLDIFIDFPFDTEAHRFAAVAYLLTLVGRSAITGCVPLTLADASMAGSGKTLIIDAASGVSFGRAMTRRAYSPSHEEQRKNITAILLAALQAVLFDNLENGSTFGSPHLDSIVTGPTWTDRVLGKSESTLELPINTVFAASGNNVALGGDLGRRVMHVRLSSPLERPEKRSGFRHPALLSYIKEHRSELLSAALTLLRAHIAAGYPGAAGLEPWGSFDEWSRVVRGAIVWVGGVDPVETRKTLVQNTDNDSGELLSLLHELQKIDPQGRGVSTATLLQAPTARAARVHLEAIAGLPDGRPLISASAGKALGKKRGVVVEGLRLASKTTNGNLVWFAEAVTP